MKCLRIACLLIVAAGTAQAQAPAGAPSSSQQQPAPVAASKSFDLSAIDKTADPCNRFLPVRMRKLDQEQPHSGRSGALGAVVLGAAGAQPLPALAGTRCRRKGSKSPLQKQFGDFYAACMDTDLVDQKGLKPIEPAWKFIAGLKKTKQLPALLAQLENDGTPDGFFEFGVGQDDKDSSKQIAQLYQGGISLPDRDYYIVDSPRFTEIRAQYVEHLKKMFTLAGDKTKRPQRKPQR